ncbi:hypothetical protein HY256_09115 [Candidatus Sumerlaeota bacterium]|nr:hypothetical protein [Candidatus Sumerlaeota bacterium]
MKKSSVRVPQPECVLKTDWITQNRSRIGSLPELPQDPLPLFSPPARSFVEKIMIL